MSIKKEQLCRVCFKVAENKFEIDENARQIFDILLIKLDLGVTRDPIICQKCMEVAKKCLNFKYTCTTTEEIILSYASDRKMVKPDIKVIFEERKHVQIALDEDSNICRFCMNRFERNNFVSLDVMMNESTFEMLSEYMAEMDLYIIDNPIVCATCREHLNVYIQFVLNCLDIEDKIKAYCRDKGTDRTGEVRLGNVLQFTLTDIFEYPDKHTQTCKIKQDYIEYVYSEAYGGFMKQDELDIKDEETIFNENSCRNSEKSNEYANETHSAMICLNTREHNTKWHTYQNHKNILETNMFKCELCSYESKWKQNLKKHMLIHRDLSEIRMFKCSLCSYECKQKNNLKSHVLVHRDISEIKRFQCSLCSNGYKYKSSLKTHMLVHKDVSEIKMFTCSLCGYKCKQKRSLITSHMLVHRDISETQAFKCSLCTKEYKRKRSLEAHMLLHKNHKDVLEIKMFKCSLCAYECKRKFRLKEHALVHKNVSEIKLFTCSLCGFECKQKHNLRAHMLVHRDISEIQVFKCSLCTNEYKHKRSLKAHMLLHKNHKDVLEIKMFKCSLCAYECKRKFSLKEHVLVHKDVSEITMFKCALCSFESKRKSCLKKHVLVHMDASEKKMFKCSRCAYESKRKDTLNRHMLTHKNVLGI